MSEASNNEGGRTGDDGRKPDVVQDAAEVQQRLTTDELQNDDWKEQYKGLKKAMLLEKLVQATKYKDKNRLEKSIKAYQESGLPSADCDELENAEKLLDILETKETLIEAIDKKDKNDIHQLLSSIYEKEKEIKNKYKEKRKTFRVEDGYKHHLMWEITEARKVMRAVALDRNKKRRNEPKPVYMDINTMSEIRGYPKPPAILHTVMQASLLLLGIDEEMTQDWSTCAKMAKPDNKEGFHKRMHTLELDEIKPEICARVKQILDGIEYTKVVAASRGGAAFYVWAMGTVEDYMKNHSLEGVEPATVDQQKVLLRTDNTETQPMFVPSINKHKGQAKVNSRQKFEHNLRAPHSAAKAEGVLAEIKY